MRVLFGQSNCSVAGTAVQLRNDSNTRVLMFRFKINSTDSSHRVYLGNSSTVSSATGYHISTRDHQFGVDESLAITFPIRQGSGGLDVTGVAPSTFWMNSSATAARLSHMMVVNP